MCSIYLPLEIITITIIQSVLYYIRRVLLLT